MKFKKIVLAGLLTTAFGGIVACSNTDTVINAAIDDNGFVTVT